MILSAEKLQFWYYIETENPKLCSCPSLVQFPFKEWDLHSKPIPSGQDHTLDTHLGHCCRTQTPHQALHNQCQGCMCGNSVCTDSTAWSQLQFVLKAGEKKSQLDNVTQITTYLTCMVLNDCCLHGHVQEVEGHLFEYVWVEGNCWCHLHLDHWKHCRHQMQRILRLVPNCRTRFSITAGCLITHMVLLVWPTLEISKW